MLLARRKRVLIIAINVLIFVMLAWLGGGVHVLGQNRMNFSLVSEDRGHIARIAPDQNDVGRFHRHVGAGADGDPEIGHD